MVSKLLCLSLWRLATCLFVCFLYLVILYQVEINYLVRILRLCLLAFTKKILDIYDDDRIACSPKQRHFLEGDSVWPIV